MSVRNASSLTRSAVLAQAWPIMVGQASIPLVGIVDTAIIGRTGDAAALAGVALGAVIIGMVFWTFGFLRMGMTGMTAQADGAGNKAEVHALLLRGLLVGGAIGCSLLLLQWPIGRLAFTVMAGGEAVHAEAGGYVSARFLGAPAALGVFAINGWLLGLGRTREALLLQVLMNVANIALDVLFIWGLGLGAMGAGLGTAGAEAIALLAGLWLCTRVAGISPRGMLRRCGWSGVCNRPAMRRLFVVNVDLMIRTVALLVSFLWFANAGARLGTETLAANHVLLQFVNVAAFVLDAFAFTAEARVGRAVGAGSRNDLLRAIRLTGEFSLVSAVLLALLFLLCGAPIIERIATDPGVREVAIAHLPWVAAVPVLGMPIWLLDGVFIGATRGAALRNAAVVACALYLMLDLWLRPLGNPGVWLAFCASYLFRGLALGLYVPGLLREAGSAAGRPAQS